MIKDKRHFPITITKKDCQHTVRAQEELSLATNDKNTNVRDYYKKTIDYFTELLKEVQPQKKNKLTVTIN